MKIVKQAQGGQSLPVTAEQLEQINRFARRELKAEEVYSFSVRLCDNEVDRDGERFPRRTLEELAELFVGKSGLFDRLEEQGIEDGDTVSIYDFEFDYTK